TLNGQASELVKKASGNYTDPGAKAKEHDDPVEKNAVTVDTVSLEVAGSFDITYTYEDSVYVYTGDSKVKLQADPVTRRVKVIDPAIESLKVLDDDLVSEIENKNVTVFVSSLDNLPTTVLAPKDSNLRPVVKGETSSEIQVVRTIEFKDSADKVYETYTVTYVLRNKPVITLNGLANVSVKKATGNYLDTGAKAKEHGGLEKDAVTVDTVSLEVKGSFDITYIYEDSVYVYSGNSKVKLQADPVTRTVKVIDPAIESLKVANDDLVSKIENKNLTVFVSSLDNLPTTVLEPSDSNLSPVVKGETSSEIQVVRTIEFKDSAEKVYETYTVTYVLRNKPVITLNGQASESVKKASGNYTDPGAKAKEHGDVEKNAVTVDTVSLEVAGSFDITYTYEDSVYVYSGNSKVKLQADPVMRTVTVIDPSIESLKVANEDLVSKIENKNLTVFVSSLDNLPTTILEPSDSNLSPVVKGETSSETQVVRTIEFKDSADDVYNTYTVTYVLRKKPVITLNGQASESVKKASGNYTDPGAKAEEHGDPVEKNAVTDDTVSLEVAGSFDITYTYEDSVYVYTGDSKVKLQADPVTRSVTVIDPAIKSLKILDDDLVGEIENKNLAVFVSSLDNLPTTIFEPRDSNLRPVVKGDTASETQVVRTIEFKDSADDVYETYTVTYVLRNKPVITLNGLASVSVKKASGNYLDPGAKAKEHGGLENVAVTVDTVSLEVAGPFDITYTYEDSVYVYTGDSKVKLQANPVTRRVTVVSVEPVAVEDTKDVVEDTETSINVLSNDVNVEVSDNPVVSIVTNPLYGTAVVEDNQIVYDPTDNSNLQDTITYKVVTNEGESTAVLTINITPVNDAPLAPNKTATTKEGVAVTIDTGVSDVDSTSLTITLGTVANGSATVFGKNVTFTPSSNYDGTTSFNYTVSDGEKTASGKITVVVNKATSDGGNSGGNTGGNSGGNSGGSPSGGSPSVRTTSTPSVKISLNRDKVDLEYGTESDPEYFQFDLDAIIKNSDSEDVTWTVEDSEVASVDENGVVKAIKQGNTVVTAVHNDSGKKASAEIIVYLVGQEQGPLGAIQFYDPYILGYPDQTFGPLRPVTRAEVATMFTKILKLNVDFPGEPKFGDIKEDDWYFNYVQAIQRTGLFVGDTDGNFRPNDPISRGEMATVFAKYWRFLNIEVVDTKVDIIDVSDSHWASDYIYTMYNAGIVADFEDGTYRPNDPTLREQIVGMINTLIARPAFDAPFSKFTDITSEHWAYGNIEAASQIYVVEQLIEEQ
ncbi:hypothetical protein EZV73_22050, partial [Acidaminobacter sp. JC074]|uniref:S-layer homology domain-containing protein n=1 Tax=Acidaminobacter sp. JC074 TaxID=2530199 RepID=UPI001F114AA4